MDRTWTRLARWPLRALGLVAALCVLYCEITIVEGRWRARRIVHEHLSRRPSTLRPDSLSEEQLAILLAVEDPEFFTHHGVDLRTPGAGMTTITQGLVKFLYFDEFRPGIAKVRQSLLAIGFDWAIDKPTQLAIFLNSGNLGTHDEREVLGFDEAARSYFGKPFAELTRAEYVALVAMCVGPNAMNVATHPERNAERVHRIERLLAGACRPAGWRDVWYDGCAGS